KERATPESGSPAPEIRLADLHQQVDRILLRDFSPAAVVINAQMDVLHFRGRTGNYLEHVLGAVSLNLLKMARESLVIDLRSLVNKAVKQDAPITQKGIQLRQNGHAREISIEVIPFHLTPSSERFFLVLFKESGPLEPQERGKDGRS